MLDLHVDFIIQQRLFRYDALKKHRPLLSGQPLFWHSDLPRLQDAAFVGACLGIHYFPWESASGPVEMHKQIDYLDAITEADEGTLRVREPADWVRAREQGKLAIAPGVEGAHMLNGQMERVEEMAARDVAYMTLAHFSKNSAATPSLGRGANESDGLTGFGKELVSELERHGIFIDVAHVNTPGVLDVCAQATHPVLCTHTGLKGAHDHARNITDAEIDAIKGTGGMIGVMFAPCFMADSLRADTRCVLDHLEYVLDRAGPDHVAIGSDLDGWLPTIPSDMRDCKDAWRVADGLLARGWEQEVVDKVTHLNALRILSGGTEQS